MNGFETDIKKVRFSTDSLIFDLVDGRMISAPLSFYPTLLNATENERENVIVAGHIAHWPLLDADLSSDCLLCGAKELPSYVNRQLTKTAEEKAEYIATKKHRGHKKIL